MEKSPTRDRQDHLHEAINAVLKTAHGQACLFWILSCCQVYQDGFTGQDNLTNYRLGKQAIGKQIIAEMNAIDPALYPRFLLEHAHLRTKADLKKDNQTEFYQDEQ